MTSDSNWKIAKLKGTENYKRWKTDAKVCLKRDGAWDLVQGFVDKPTTDRPKQPTEEDKDDKEKWDAYKKEMKEWNKTNSKYLDINSKAWSGIIGACEDGPRAHVSHLDDAEEIWMKLQTLYEVGDLSAYDNTIHAITHCELKQFKDLHEYTTAIKKHQTKLEDMGEALPNKLITSIFRQGLTEEYHPIIFSMRQSSKLNKKEIPLDEYLSTLVEYDRQRGDKKGPTASYTKAGNFGKQPKGPKRSRDNSTSRRNKQGCFHCNEEGHLKRNCPYLYANHRPKDWKPKDDKLMVEKLKRDTSQAVVKQDNPVRQKFFRALSARAIVRDDDVYLDTGADVHAFWKKDRFVEYTPAEDLQLAGIDGVQLPVAGVGIIQLPCMVNGRYEPLNLTGAWHVPDIYFNLVSWSQLNKINCTAFFGLDRFVVFDGHGMDCPEIMTGMLKGSDYVIDLDPTKMPDRLAVTQEAPKALTTTSTAQIDDEGSWDDLHRRLGHPGMSLVKDTAKVTTGINVKKADRIQKVLPNTLCWPCMQGKQSRHDSRTPRRRDPRKRAQRPAQMWHVDSSGGGNITVAMPGQIRRLLAMTCDKTDRTFVYGMKSKKEGPHYIGLHLKRMRAQNKVVAVIRGDNEFGTSEYQAIYAEHGITFEPTSPDNPHQNGVAERTNRTLWERIRTVLYAAQISHGFWYEAAMYVAYTKDRLPSTILRGKTPFEAWYGMPPSVDHLHSFGCICYHHQEHRSGKLSSKSTRCRFLGYEGTNQYRLWDPNRRRVIRSAQVKFDEKAGAKPKQEGVTGQEIMFYDGNRRIQTEYGIFEWPMSAGPDPTPTTSQTGSDESEGSEDDDGGEADHSLDEDSDPDRPTLSPEVRNECPGSPGDEDNGTSFLTAPEPDTTMTTGDRGDTRRESSSESSSDNESNDESSSLGDESGGSSTPVPRRSSRTKDRKDYRKMAGKRTYRNHFCQVLKVAKLTSLPGVGVPTDVNAALSGADKAEWLEAFQTELKQHHAHGTWRLVKREPWMKVIPGRWVLTHKLDSMGVLVKRKARWVAKGFYQKYGIDFDEIFSSVIKAMCWRILLAMAAMYDWEAEHSDVVTAFLASELVNPVYVEQPHQFVQEGKEGHVCLLLRALYGLKQAPREWYTTLKDFLKSIGFRVLVKDTSTFINPSSRVIVAVYVDDLLILAPNKESISKFKYDIGQRFNMKHLGEVAHYLGMQVIRDRPRRIIYANQTAFIIQLLDQFGMKGCHAAKTPMDKSIQYRRADDNLDAPADFKKAYQSLMGALQWLATMTRPDISYAVSKLSAYNANPTEEHMIGAKRILRYLAGTIDVGLRFGPIDGDEGKLAGYSDASHADDLDTRRSTMGYIFKLWNGPISWRSKPITHTTKSTAESEYIAAAEAADELEYLKELLTELQYAGKDVQQGVLNIDNTAAIDLSNNPINHPRSKHIQIRYHRLRELVSEFKTLSLHWVPSAGQAADILTKPLGPNEFVRAREMLGLGSTRRSVRLDTSLS